ncbi:hypothetical protein G6F63_014287 [Rhizopus arrhizus]|nr:hypothetical protein G6F63_014287 [Rhizopus arrhizus]
MRLQPGHGGALLLAERGLLQGFQRCQAAAQPIGLLAQFGQFVLAVALLLLHGCHALLAVFDLFAQFVQRGLLRVTTSVPDAQHHVDKGVVRMAINNQAVVHAQRSRPGTRQREQRAVAHGGILHRAHQRARVQVQVARVLNPDVGHVVSLTISLSC